MCDTMIVTGELAADGVTVFGKNSDREPNEAQYIAHIPAADHPAGAQVRCTYLEIPQVKHTHAVLLSKPFWMWGAEMGANEHGLVIGNEAVFSKVPGPKTEALLGMDLLRLGLERAETAHGAIEVITSLLEQFGQGGHAGYAHPTYYHNSFLIADPGEAWVLETVERRWAARRVTGAASISNCLTLGSQLDLVSADLVTYAQDKRWSKGLQDFDLARDYSDFIYTTFGRGRKRQQRSQALLRAKGGEATIFAIFSTLRDHGKQGADDYRPDANIFDFTICAHAGFGPVRATQTTGSMVAYLSPERPVFFLTGTSAPCTSVFKPVWLDAGLPDLGPDPTGSFDPATLFWQHELLHRATMQYYGPRLQHYRQQRDEMEARFVQKALDMNRAATKEERLAFSASCFREAAAAEKGWLQSILKIGEGTRPNRFYHLAWNQFNQQAKLSL